MQPTLEAPSFIEEGPSRLLPPHEVRQRIRSHANTLGINPDLCEGFSHYLVDNLGIGNSASLGVGLELMAAINELMDGNSLYKARSFVYLPTSSSIPEIAHQVFNNAQFMIDRFGRRLFEPHPTIDKQPGGVYKAPLGSSDFYLSCKGGSGSGTFSLDLAIGVNHEREYDRKIGVHNVRGELWRMGVDTKLDSSGKRELRIVRTGSGFNRPEDPVKEQQFAAYRREYNTLPQRALAFIGLYLAYDLGIDRAVALTTEGAIALSTLGRSKGKCDYSGIFGGVGFEASADPNWLHVDGLQGNFYDRLIGHGGDSGLRVQEVKGIDELIDAFNNLRTMTGENFPLTLCPDNNGRHASELVMAAFSRLYNFRKGAPI